MAIWRRENIHQHVNGTAPDAEHMYYAAMNSKSCRLTALGAYYYSLVVKGRI